MVCPSILVHGVLIGMMINEKDIVEQALEFFANGEVKNALAALDQAITIAEEQDDQLQKARVMGKKGVIFLEVNQLEAARHCLENVLTLSEELENQELKADALSNLGLVFTAGGDPGTGLLKQQEATIIAREAGNPRQIMNHIGLLGHAYIQLANMEEAGKAYIEAMQIAREIDDFDSLRGFLNNLGIIFANLDQHENAVRAFAELSEMAAESGDFTLALNANKNLVKHAIAMGEIEQVIHHSRQGLDLIDAHLSGAAEREAFEDMLVLGLMSNNNYQQAKQELAQIINTAEETKDTQKLLKAVSQMSDAHYALGELEAAEKEYKHALEISIRLQAKLSEARLLSRLAALSADVDDLEKSNQYLLKGLKINDVLNEQEIVGEQHYLLALNFQEMGELDKAKEHARKSVEAYLASEAEYLGEKARILLESL